MYFPFSIPKSGRKRSAHSRRRFAQSFLSPLLAVDAPVDVRGLVGAAEQLGQLLLGLGDALGVAADAVVFQTGRVDGFFCGIRAASSRSFRISAMRMYLPFSA